jgi:hypothetical protein
MGNKSSHLCGACSKGDTATIELEFPGPANQVYFSTTQELEFAEYLGAFRDWWEWEPIRYLG